MTRRDTQGLVVKIEPAILPILPNYYVSAIHEQLGGKSLMDRPVGRASDSLRAGEGERVGTAGVCDHGGGRGGSKPVSWGSDGRGDVTQCGSIEVDLGGTISGRGEKCLIGPSGA